MNKIRRKNTYLLGSIRSNDVDFGHFASIIQIGWEYCSGMQEINKISTKQLCESVTSKNLDFYKSKLF